MRLILRTAAAALLLGISAMAADAAPGREYPIGTITYDAAPLREVITLRRGEGDFRAIRLEVRQSDVEIRDMRITYDDGSSDVIRVGQLIRAGGSSRLFDVDSRRREVRSVAVTYLPQGPARITLFGVGGGGNPGPGPGPGPGDWTLLGCKDVKFLSDRDTLKLNREGRFVALRLKVRKAAVEMLNMRVSFLSGARVDLPMREVIPPGSVSRPVDLMSRERGIERIEMIYRSIPSNKGAAEICVDALER